MLNLDPQPEEMILSDQKRIIVDSFARYKIIDPLEFRKKALTDANFRQIFGGRLNAAVRAEVGKVFLGDMLYYLCLFDQCVLVVKLFCLYLFLYRLVLFCLVNKHLG